MTTTDTTPAAETTVAPVTIAIDDGPLTADSDGRNRGWRASLVLNPETRTVYPFTCVGSGTPANVWHNLALSLSVSAVASGKHLREMLEGDEAQAILAAIIDTYEGESWDGHNNVGRWSCDENGLPDYTCDVATLEAMIEAVPTFWSASDYLSPAWSECKREVEEAILGANDEAAEKAAIDALIAEWASSGATNGALVDEGDLRACVDRMVTELTEGDAEDLYLVEGEDVDTLDTMNLNSVVGDLANLGETWCIVEARSQVDAATKARALMAQGGAAVVAEVRRLADEWNYPVNGVDALAVIVTALPA